VLAICPKSPGPCEAAPCCCAGARGCCVGAYVEADRVCCGAGAGARGGVGRDGARPEERERGILGGLVGLGGLGGR